MQRSLEVSRNYRMLERMNDSYPLTLNQPVPHCDLNAVAGMTVVDGFKVQDPPATQRSHKEISQPISSEPVDQKTMTLQRAYQKVYGITPPIITSHNIAHMDLTEKQQVQLLDDFRNLAQLALDHVLAARRTRAQASANDEAPQ